MMSAPSGGRRPIWLGAEQVANLLGRRLLVDALDSAFREGCQAPRRHHHTVGVPNGRDATLLLMPAWIPGRFLGTKIASVFPDNRARGLPAVQSVYLLSSAETGALLAIIDGGELTTRRTVAASSLAARYLARGDASRLLIVGTGEIARQIAASHAAVRPIQEVEIWGRNRTRAEALAAELVQAGFEARSVEDLAAATQRADIVSCCTLSREPVISGAWLRPGTHLDLIGSFTPEMRETDDAAVARALVVVDTDAALTESGDLAVPLRNGTLTQDRIATDLAGLVRGRHPGRTDADEITLFKSVGAAIEDLTAAILCYASASHHNALE